MYIFSKGVRENRARLKGRNLSQFSSHLESEGWPTEFFNEEHRDRVKSQEARNRYPLKDKDAGEVVTEMKVPTLEEGMQQRAACKKCVKGDTLTPEQKKDLRLDDVETKKSKTYVGIK